MTSRFQERKIDLVQRGGREAERIKKKGSNTRNQGVEEINPSNEIVPKANTLLLTKREEQCPVLHPLKMGQRGNAMVKPGPKKKT